MSEKRVYDHGRRALIVLLFMLGFMLAALAFLPDGTLAYFTASDTARNVITAGSVDIDLSEKDAEGNAYRDPVNVVPGAAVDKIVTVKNTGDNPCWVRIFVKKSLNLSKDAEGTGDVDLSLIALDINTADWIEKDGAFYYKKALAPGESTEALFTCVSFSPEMGNLYKNSVAEILVRTEVVQSENNADSVLSASGWPSDGEGGGGE